MFGKTFYHGTIKRYVTLMGTLVNDIWINRRDSNNNVKQSFKVPVSYGPREKFLARVTDIDAGYDPQEQEFAIVMPRIGFEITNIQYAPERKITTSRKWLQNVTATPDQKEYIYNPVPYDIYFTVSAFVKNTEDGTQIVEQILPYFSPDWTPRVRLIDDPEIIVDIPVVLQGVSQDDVYEGTWEERRSLIWNLEFAMKGYFFGPKRTSEIITLANTNIFDEVYDTGPASVNMSVVPGQDANGNPTTNSAITVGRNSILANSDYDYIVTINENVE